MSENIIHLDNAVQNWTAGRCHWRINSGYTRRYLLLINIENQLQMFSTGFPSCFKTCKYTRLMRSTCHLLILAKNFYILFPFFPQFNRKITCTWKYFSSLVRKYHFVLYSDIKNIIVLNSFEVTSVWYFLRTRTTVVYSI